MDIHHRPGQLDGGTLITVPIGQALQHVTAGFVRQVEPIPEMILPIGVCGYRRNLR